MEIVHRIGDVCAEDHGGGALVKDEYGYHLEYTHGLETEHLERRGALPGHELVESGP